MDKLLKCSFCALLFALAAPAPLFGHSPLAFLGAVFITSMLAGVVAVFLKAVILSRFTQTVTVKLRWMVPVVVFEAFAGLAGFAAWSGTEPEVLFYILTVGTASILNLWPNFLLLRKLGEPPQPRRALRAWLLTFPYPVVWSIFMVLTGDQLYGWLGG